MRKLRLFPALAVILLGSQLKADTYKLYFLDTFSNTPLTILGLTDASQVVISLNGHYNYTYMQCNIGDSCFLTYTPGGGVVHSASPVSVSYDSGSVCAANQVPSTSHASQCNGEHIAYTQTSKSGYSLDLFGGTNMDASLIFEGVGVEQLKTDQYGDIAFVNATVFSNNIYEAVDLTTRMTPEPSSIAFLGTGLAGAVAAIRRRKD